MSRWLTTEQAADYIGYREGTLRVWRAKEVGPPYVKAPGGGVRYSSDDLDTWITSALKRPL